MYNSKQEDIVVMGITSNIEKQRDYIVPISNNDLEKGNLSFQSQISCDKLMSVHKTTIIALFGILSKKKFFDSIQKLNELLKETN